jgi:ribosomal protein S27E
VAEARGRANVSVRSVNCPNCGAATAVRMFGHAVNVVCQSCQSILDAANPGVTILQKFKEAVRHEPLIPLGTRGTLLDTQYEVVGFQVRQIVVDGDAYQWREYLLFNPYREFRYLTEYAGHWNVVSTLRALPAGGATPDGSAPRTFQGQTYRHFQSATAATVFVLGEFPWQIRVGDKANTADYVAPPKMLSAEINADKEVTWSLGHYLSGADVWKGLSLPGEPPEASGVFADQPSPFGSVPGALWRIATLLVAVATVLWMVHVMTAKRKQSFSQTYVFDPNSVQDASLVTPIFELDGRPSAVRVETRTNLDNQWMSVGYALINEDTGQAYDFAREVSYYHGTDGGESWTEGSIDDSVILPHIPPGRYFLRIEPEGDRGSRTVQYRVTVVRDVSTSLWFLGALVLLAVPPIVTSWRAAAFEGKRWAESDHGSTDSSGDDEGDDDDD